MPFSLRALLTGSGAGVPEITVAGINADSRAIKAGDAFFAAPGLHTHGDAFAAEVRAKGAVVMVTDRMPASNPGIPVVVVSDVRAAYARAAAVQFAPQPATIVGVTGTSGKSSIVSFVRQIWAAVGIDGASMGTVGIETGAGLRSGELTTPDALTLHSDLGALKAEGIDHVAMEASSQGLDQHRVDGVRFAAAGFTNLSRDHLDYHETMDIYRDAKLRLFTELVAHEGTAVVNADDPVSRHFIEAGSKYASHVWTVGRAGDWFKIKSISNEGYGQRVMGSLEGADASFYLPLTGDFQVSNALVATGLASATGVAPRQALEALAKLKGARGRLEFAGEYNGAAIFVDYAHKPAALEAALSALRPYASNRLHVVFGAGGDRDKGKRPLMGEAATRMADGVIVTDDNPRMEDAAQIRREILAAAPAAREIGDRREAIGTAIRSLQPGDVLLIAGKGHEDYQIIGKTKHHFSDHEVIAETLRSL